jgi:hypothetical protein
MSGNFAKRGLLHSALRETQAIIANPRLLAVFAVIVVVFAVTGPFGTLETMGLAQRLGYWFVAQATSWTVAIFSIHVADRLFGARIRPEPLRVLVTGAAAGVPVSLAALLFGGDLWADGGGLEPGEAARVFATSIPLTMGFSVLSWLVLGGREASLADPDADAGFASRGEHAAHAKPKAAPAVPDILMRLPPEKRGPLMRLSAADHYVEIVTSRGSDLVLMRLGDAIAGTAPVEGLQVHRSHWVALSAIAGVQTTNGRTRLLLQDGSTLPVSRALAGEVRARLEARRDPLRK